MTKKKKCKKAKWLSEEALQITEKRRNVKGKGERERYTQLKAKFQRIARRDKKAFLSEQGKPIQENKRIGKTKGNGTPSSTLVWKIPWMEEPGGLQSIGSLRSRT